MPARMPYDYIETPSGTLTTPPGSPQILIHTRQGKIAGIYCDQPAKILEVETQDSLTWVKDPASRGFLSVISPQTSFKSISGHVTSVHRMAAMPFDDPSMDDDLRGALNAHEIVLDGECVDVE